jgi:hypothetical protein
MINYNYNIPTSGLVQCVDAANPRSYPGSGSTWYDVTGNGHNIALGAGVTYQSGTGRGVLQFAKDSTGYGTNSTLNLSASNNTVISFVRKLVDGDVGRTITALNNNWLMAHHDSTYGDYYAEGWVSAVQAGTSDTNWRIYAALGNQPTDTWSLYVNNSLSAGPNSGGGLGPDGISIGAQTFGGTSEFSTGQFSFVLVYNRVLTTAEMTQNYNFFKGRFGL